MGGWAECPNVFSKGPGDPLENGGYCWLGLETLAALYCWIFVPQDPTSGSTYPSNSVPRWIRFPDRSVQMFIYEAKLSTDES